MDRGEKAGTEREETVLFLSSTSKKPSLGNTYYHQIISLLHKPKQGKWETSFHADKTYKSIVC